MSSLSERVSSHKYYCNTVVNTLEVGLVSLVRACIGMRRRETEGATRDVKVSHFGEGLWQVGVQGLFSNRGVVSKRGCGR